MRINQIIITLILFVSNFIAQTQENIPAELLFKDNVFSNFSISPNGNYFATLLEHNIGYEIVIIDIKAKKVYKKIPISINRIGDIFWINDRRLLYENSGQIIAINIDGTDSAIIINRQKGEIPRYAYYRTYYKYFQYNSIINPLWEDKEHVLAQSIDYKGYADVVKVNVFTGEKTYLVKGKDHKINSWLVNKNGRVVVGIRKVGDSFIYLKKNIKNNKWEEFNIVIDERKYPLKIQGGTYLDQRIIIEDLGFESGIIYLGININSDKRKLITYDLSKNEVVNTVLQDSIYDISDPHANRTKLTFSKKDKNLIGVKYQGTIPVFKWLNSKFQTFQNQLNKKYSTYVNEIIDFDQEEENLLVYQWNDYSFGKICIYNTKDDVLNTILSFNEDLNEYKLLKSKPISFKAKDGYQIQAYLTIPDSNADQKIPLVVIPHGGPWARDYWDFDAFSQFFASRGYAALRVNFRGSAGYGRSHLLSGIKNISGLMIDDITDGVNYICKQYNISEDNLYIFGHSYGGYAAYMSVIRHPEKYKAAVAVSAPTDIYNWMKNQKKEGNLFAYEFWKTALGNNLKDKGYLNSISPIQNADKIQTPIFIFHGKKDSTIDVSHAEKMQIKLESLNKVLKIRLIQNEGHTMFNSNNVGYILDMTLDFFKSYE